MKLGNIFFALAVTVSMLMTASCDSVRHCDSSVPYADDGILRLSKTLRQFGPL